MDNREQRIDTDVGARERVSSLYVKGSFRLGLILFKQR